MILPQGQLNGGGVVFYGAFIALPKEVKIAQVHIDLAGTGLQFDGGPVVFQRLRIVLHGGVDDPAIDIGGEQVLAGQAPVGQGLVALLQVLPVGVAQLSGEGGGRVASAGEGISADDAHRLSLGGRGRGDKSEKRRQ